MQEHLGSVGVREVGSTVGNGAQANIVRNPSPAATSLLVHTEWLANGVPVVSVAGELDLTTAPALEEVLLDLRYGAAEAVIVDLARCSFIDLRALRVLLAAREHLERSSRPLALVVANPSLLRVFEITRVDDLFDIYPSLAAATGGGYGG